MLISIHNKAAKIENMKRKSNYFASDNLIKLISFGYGGGKNMCACKCEEKKLEEFLIKKSVA